MAETIVMDPSAVATGRTQLNITNWIKWDGIDWGEQAITAYMADMSYGSSPVDFRVPNRQITIPLALKQVGTTGFESIRGSIQAKVARWQQEGGWLQRISSDGGTLYLDVVNAGITLGGGYGQAMRDYDVDAQLTLEALPDFYGDEVTLADHVETSAAELIFTETNVRGNYPARVRMVVDDDEGQSQLGLAWGYRSLNYSAASTAALAYEAEALQPLDTAVRAALAGASGGSVVTHGTLSTNWTPVLGTNIGGTGYLTHVGTYRWWCRYRTTAGTALQIRGVYDVGDLVNPEENPLWTHPATTAGTALYIADLGQIRLDQAPVGTHRWAGQIQAKGAVGSENVSIDRVWFQPLDESAGILRAPAMPAMGLSTYSARSDFTTESGAITGDTALVGGVWVGAGDTDDFSVAAGVATRTAVSDSGAGSLPGRKISLPVSMTSTAVQVDVSATTATPVQGVIARYVDTSNLLVLYRVGMTSANNVCVYKMVAGTGTLLGVATINLGAVGGYTRLRLQVATDGRWFAWAYPTTATPGDPVLSGQDAVLATGGALASGNPGIYDEVVSSPAVTRTVDNFLAWAPNFDAVLQPSQSLEMRTDGMVREDATGTAYGPVSSVEGDLPRLPVSGVEGRTVQVMVKASRGDFATLPDTGIDNVSTRLFYRPCWLTAPGT